MKFNEEPKIEPHDSINEVGPKNQYDVTAGEALLFAEKHGYSELRSEAIRLGELIRNIPFNHDKFYKVISQKEKVRQMMDTYSEYHHLDLPSEEWPQNNIFENNKKQWAITIGFHRRNHDNDNKTAIPEDIKKLFESNLYAVDHEEEEIGGGCVDYYTYYEMKTIQPIQNFEKIYGFTPDGITIITRKHENGIDYGMTIRIDGANSRQQAMEFLKNILIEKK